MEALLHKHEECVGQNAREGPNDARTQQLNPHELHLVRGQESFVLVDQAECDDAPKATEQVRLSGLQRIVQLKLVEDHASEEINESSDSANDHCRVDLDVA